MTPTLRLKTITEPGVALSPSLITELQGVIPQFFKSLFRIRSSEDALPLLGPFEYLNLSKSTPVTVGLKGRFTSTSFYGIALSASHMIRGPMRPIFIHMMGYLYNQQGYKVIDQIYELARHVAPLNPDLPLGKLGFKVEAAGKLRVFAMVDWCTQCLLYPVHNLIFKLLSGLETDGTFDQLKPVKRLLQNKFISTYYCYDLSAATDRLPCLLQAHLLDYLLGGNMGHF
jgi:hypothetical protein